MGIFNFFRSGKPTPEKPLDIDLSDLAKIWLQYNESFAPQKGPVMAVEASKCPVDGQSATGNITPAVNEAPSGQGATGILDDSAQTFLSPLVMEFVEPYKQIFQNQRSLEGVLRLIDLLEKHGQCPSVVQDRKSRDSDAEELPDSYDILAKVTLYDHSFRVTKHLLQLTKDTYRSFDVMAPRAVITGLGHDIGKMPVLRDSGLYAVADHPVISAKKVQEIFSGSGTSSLSGVVEAIRDHHSTGTEQWTVLLKKADGLAREQEIVEVMGGEVSFRKWKEWFKAEEFLALVKPHINKMINPNKWQAFSLRGVVYCEPDFILETAKTLAAQKKVLDITLLRAIDKDAARARIVKSLMEAGVVCPEVGVGYIGRKYEANTGQIKKILFLTPLKAEAFGMPSQLEAEQPREGYLKEIKEMKLIKY